MRKTNKNPRLLWAAIAARGGKEGGGKRRPAAAARAHIYGARRATSLSSAMRSWLDLDDAALPTRLERASVTPLVFGLGGQDVCDGLGWRSSLLLLAGADAAVLLLASALLARAGRRCREIGGAARLLSSHHARCETLRRS